MTPTTTNDTSLGAAEAAQVAAVEAWIIAKNAQLAREYLAGSFGNWNLNYQAGKIPWNATPPQPPNGYKSVGYITDPTDAAAQWPYAIQDGPPVCAVPDYPKVPPPQNELPKDHVHVGKPISGTSYYSIGMDDTTASGFITPPVAADDGSVGIWEKVAYPFGGWYLTHQILKKGGA